MRIEKKAYWEFEERDLIYGHRQCLMYSKRKGIPEEMQEKCFTTTFDVLSVPKMERLEQIYQMNSGRLPTRMNLREISQQLQISQNRIKKWFYDRNSNENRTDSLSKEVNELKKEIEDNWRLIREMGRSGE